MGAGGDEGDGHMGGGGDEPMHYDDQGMDMGGATPFEQQNDAGFDDGQTDATTPHKSQRCAHWTCSGWHL